jgi:hypothetical protein
MKKKNIILILIIVLLLAAGCTNKQAPNNTKAPNNTTTPNQSTGTKPDATTTASIVDNNTAFKNAISKNGTWIIATLKDLTFTEDLVLDGTFKNGKKDTAGNEIIQRKIALYAQDKDRNVTARYNLTAPKLTINSPNARIQSGTFKGDLYVSAENFELVDAKVDGNIYFTNDKAKSSFKMDEKSSVTGKQELKK